MPLNAAEVVEYAALSRQKAMNAVIDRGDSAVQQFYCDAVVFVTGGSGFLGKQLIEKLFRSCRLKKIYVLLRNKKEKMIQERLELMLKDPVFDIVRDKQPHFADRIVIMEGDVTDIRLGLSDKDWTTITEEVDTFFHVAATVRFQEPLRMATFINIRGTRECLTLARACPKLKQFVHVSTAFCHATSDWVGKELLEQFYPVPLSPDFMIGLAEEMDENRLNGITTDLIKGWPNTYTFTKAIAEELVRTVAGDLPVCVVRPPGVTCSYYEPCPGWLDMSCVFQISGFVLGIGLGVIRVAHVDKYNKMNLVPLEIVNNTIIAAGWDSAERRRNGDTDIPVYNVANEESSITFDAIAKTMRKDCIKYSSPKAMWRCFLIEVKSSIMYNIVSFLLHYIPAYIIDIVCGIFRVKIKGVSSFVKIYQKYDKLSALNKFFFLNEFKFKDYNVKALISKMSDADKAIFNCDLSTVDYEEFVRVWCLGIRKYLLKDGLRGVSKGYRRQKIFLVAHYVIMALYVYVLWSILCMCWSLSKFMVGI